MGKFHSKHVGKREPPEGECNRVVNSSLTSASPRTSIAPTDVAKKLAQGSTYNDWPVLNLGRKEDGRQSRAAVEVGDKDFAGGSTALHPPVEASSFACKSVPCTAGCSAGHVFDNQQLVPRAVCFSSDACQTPSAANLVPADKAGEDEQGPADEVGGQSNCQNWSFTLYDCDREGNGSNEDAERLLCHLREVVRSSIAQPRCSGQVVRLRLSVATDSPVASTVEKTTSSALLSQSAQLGERSVSTGTPEPELDSPWEIRTTDFKSRTAEFTGDVSGMLSTSKWSGKSSSRFHATVQEEGEGPVGKALIEDGRVLDEKHLAELVQRNMDLNDRLRRQKSRKPDNSPAAQHSSESTPASCYATSTETCRKGRSCCLGQLHHRSKTPRPCCCPPKRHRSRRLKSDSTAVDASGAADLSKLPTAQSTRWSVVTGTSSPKTCHKAFDANLDSSFLSPALSSTARSNRVSSAISELARVGSSERTDDKKEPEEPVQQQRRRTALPTSEMETVSSSHYYRRHRHRARNQSRAMRQVAEWVEHARRYGELSNGDVVQRHVHHHIHEHYHHHFHHRKDDTSKT